MTLLISACLLGCSCRYDGRSKPLPTLDALFAAGHTLIPFCPEIFGGLPTPRPPAERKGESVINTEGQDVTDAYVRGAAQALELVRLFRCDAALLKARSPSCGRDTIYDGTFSGTTIPGHGVTAALLLEHDIPVFTEAELELLL